MNRNIPLIALSSASFLLGVHYSDTIRERFGNGFIRKGHAESALVQNLPQELGDINHKSLVQANSWTQLSRSSQIMEYGYPGFDNLRTYTDHVISYDRRTRNAHWVMEHLTPDCLAYDPEVNRSK
jgi:DNA/RNA endonuclease G (NUC1)